MRKILYMLIAGICLMPLSSSAQTFFGYQTIGVHTFYFSLSWQDKPHLGVGYTFRNFGRTFTDLSAEIRFPVDEIYRFENHQIIAGMYKPLRMRRTFAAVGAHLRIDKETTAQNSQTHYGLAATLLPTYAYAASLTDGLYNTMALRATYNPILFSRIKDEGETIKTQFLTGHRLQLGGHLDLHVERTFTVSSDAYVSRIFGAKTDFQGKEEEGYQAEGNLYIGAAYSLRRW